MNKKVLAVAVAGVFAAPAVVLAQSSTVQLYGRITYEYGYADQGGGRPKTDVAQTPGGSAIGFRGQEKLGGGLTAWFQCESSADVRGASQDGLCSRNSAIGFKGGWGNLHFGRWDSPFKRAVNMGTVGVQDTGLLGSAFVFAGSSTGTGAGFNDPDRNVWKRRESGLTYYESPTFSGFQVLAAFSPGNAATSGTNSTTSSKPRVLSLGGTWKHGPFAVGVGYEKHDEMLSRTTSVSAVGTGSTALPAFATVSSTTVRGVEGNDKAWNISASYTFANKLEIGVAYLDTKYEGVSTNGDELKRKSWIIGLDWAIQGPHGLEIGYVEADKTKGSCTSTGANTCTIGNVPPAATGVDNGAKLFEIKYRYSFSKRTSARLGYVKLKNDQGAFYALGGLSRPVSNGEDQDAIVLYLQHNF